MAAVLTILVGSASGQIRLRAVHAAPRVTVVAVIAGKPAELGFRLSKFSKLPAGTVTFKVTNQGLGFHNFKICTIPVKTSAKNSCVGKATPLLKHGQSATLTVKLTKNGTYEFLCAVPGHAAAGMKGLLGVGVAVAATSPVGNVSQTTTTTPATTTTPVAGGGGGGGAVAECPPGQTIVSAGGNDNDEDEGGAPSDGDGCI
jgi:uncharacterized cupredoxin-like copper-binding protein